MLVWGVFAWAQHSTDNGTTWTAATPFGGSYGLTTKILAHPVDPSSAIVTFSGFDVSTRHIALTTDMGVSWSDVTGDLPSQPVNTIAIDPQEPDHWYIGTDVGVWASTNSGVNWVPYQVGLPNVVVTDLHIRSSTRKLVAGTYGRGAWEVDITPPISTGVVSGAPASLDLMLDPPMPNPAHDHVILRFAAKHEGTVSLDVFDVAGRRVATVASLNSGDGFIRAATWLTDDATNGVYFAVLKAGDQRVSRKIVVAR
jgi:hypothetical protein